MKIVVVGGTGLVGRGLVRELTARGHEAVVASPSTGVNAVTGEGLKEALHGADVVVDVTNSPSFEASAVLDFFTSSTSNLLAAEAEAAVGHHVALSIVGAERSPDGDYLRAKVAQEKLIENASTPFTIVRATQFFEFLRDIADTLTDGDTVRASTATLQPIAVDDVVTFLADTAVAGPVNGRVDIAGPEKIGLDELLRTVLAADGDPRVVEGDPNARYFGAALSDMSLVPLGEARIGGVYFADWLASHPKA